MKIGKTGDAFDKLMASKSGSATTVFAFQASVYTLLRRDKTPVMSFEVFTRRE